MNEWSETEIAILYQIFQSAEWKQIAAALPNRTRVAIGNKARKLGLHRERVRKHWTKPELDILASVWSSAPRDDVLAALPGRTWNAICDKASCAGLRRIHVAPGGWPHEEEIRLRTMWVQKPQPSVREMADALGRTRNIVIGKAHRLGLPTHDGATNSTIDKEIRMGRKREKDAYMIAMVGGPAPKTCQWIEGEPSANPDFCGEKAEPDRPYCAEHCARAYRTGGVEDEAA